MIKVETIVEFTLNDFDKLKNLVRKDISKNEKGRLYVGDIFECNKEMVEYLTGKNTYNKVVVQIIEVKDETQEIQKEATKKKTTKPRKAKK